MLQGRFDSALASLLGQVHPDGPVLLAVSGGIDSMCMADLFLNSVSCRNFALAHCNFHLRGSESDSDEALVASWAQSRGIKFYKQDFDTQAYAVGHGLSIEMAARELRYQWFASLAESEGFAAVALAHNANDNAETLILNMLRGTGIKGAAGMEEVSPNPCRPEGAPLIRPLLQFTRKQIEGQALARGLQWREDSTNSQVEFKRNKIRNQVFPIFETINPSFIKTLNREMDYFAQVGAIADDYFRTHSTGLVSPDAPELRLDIARLTADRHWKYLLYRFMDGYGFSSAVIQSVCTLIENGGTIGGKTFQGSEYELLTSSSELIVRRRSAAGSDSDDRYFSASDPIMVIRGEGKYCFNGRTITVTVEKWDAGQQLKQPEGTIIFDRAALDFPFVCRRWLPGDWFRPLGLKGKKKLSDLFTDLKYGPLEKEAAIVLVDPSRGQEQRIAAVLGVRIDDALKVKETTTEIIKLK